MAANAVDQEMEALYEALEIVGFINDPQAGRNHYRRMIVKGTPKIIIVAILRFFACRYPKSSPYAG